MFGACVNAVVEGVREDPGANGTWGGGIRLEADG